VALDLDAAGFVVFAGCLYPDGEGARELKARASKRLHVLDLDVSSSEKVEKCAQYIEQFCKQSDMRGWMFSSPRSAPIDGGFIVLTCAQMCMFLRPVGVVQQRRLRDSR
jgi:hypothetical protein